MFLTNIIIEEIQCNLFVHFADVREVSSTLSPGPALEYTGTVWAFAPLSGLLQLHPDGSIISIHNHLALSLFGYSKDELQGKVSQHDQLNEAV